MSHKLLIIYIYIYILIFKCSWLYKNWRAHFKHEDDNFQYFLRDVDYIGVEMNVLYYIEIKIQQFHLSYNVLIVFNKIQAKKMNLIEVENWNYQI